MKKGERFEWIKISKKEYQDLLKAGKHAKSVKIFKRVQAFKLMYRGWKYSAIAESLSVTNNTISEWVKLYHVGGISALLLLNYRGGQSRLSEAQLSELRQKSSEGMFSVAKEIKEYIAKNFGINYHLSHVQLLAKKNFHSLSRRQS